MLEKSTDLYILTEISDMYFSVVSPWFFHRVLLAVTTGVQSKVQSRVRTKPSPGVNISPHIVPASPALMYTLPS